MIHRTATSKYRLGVDVGGTNTDCVLIERIDNSDGQTQPWVQAIASHKTATTTNVTSGIESAIQKVLEASRVSTSEILSLNIGTTHFINAVIEMDVTRLSRVAVLRLCGPFCREIAPFEDFPPALEAVVRGHVGYLDGGLEVDGRTIMPINTTQVIEQAAKIRECSNQAVVTVGVFSPIDSATVTQEEIVKNILVQHLPDVDIVMSRDIGGLGFVERENAAILNASIVRYGRRMISAFQRAKRTLGLDCPLYVSQNDGTVLEASLAACFPIKTFSSGATNSLTGAAFLAAADSSMGKLDPVKEQVIVIDVGGTSSDLAALTASGFPRQSSATVRVGGVRTMFAMPEVLSLGLGGGSVVNVQSDGNVTIGPKSVGNRLQAEAQCFGGKTLTATDIAVASENSAISIMPVWKEAPSAEVVARSRKIITRTLEKGIELMKTSDQDVTALLVGGGATIQLEQLRNVKRCLMPRFYDAANAVGAAIAKIAGEIDCIRIVDGPIQDIVDQLKVVASDLAMKNGAEPGTTKIIEVEAIPLQYMNDGAVRIRVKAVGELSWHKSDAMTEMLDRDYVDFQDAEESDASRPMSSSGDASTPQGMEIDLSADANLEAHRPRICANSREWIVSETDVAFMAEGTGVLGTGGGGSVRSEYLACIRYLRRNGMGSMRIIEAAALPANSQVALIAWTGAPTVGNERLSGGSEVSVALNELQRLPDIGRVESILGPEVGGANGICALPLAASLGLPVVDADTLGRAFPRTDMSLPYVFDKAVPWPAVFTDARAEVHTIPDAQDQRHFEDLGRELCVKLGSSAAMALNPMRAEIVQQYCCLGSLSLAWFIGREVALARQKKSDPAAAVLRVTGGRLLYSGKVTNVERSVKGGWTIGTATVEPCAETPYPADVEVQSLSEPLELIFQNEFLAANLVTSPYARNTLCTVPDLITVLDQDGTAVDTHTLRYGLLVQVIAMPANPLWKTPEGLKIGGPAAFGLGDEQVSCGEDWASRPSVIETYTSAAVRTPAWERLQ